MLNHRFPHRLFGAALLAIAAIFTAPNFAQAAGASPHNAVKQCFYARDINGWSRINDHTVRVQTGPKKAYDLTLMGPITDLAFREHIGVQSSPSNFICTGNGLGVSIVTTGAFKSTYPVTNIAPAPTKTAAHVMRKKEKQASREDRIAAGRGAQAALDYVDGAAPDDAMQSY